MDKRDTSPTRAKWASRMLLAAVRRELETARRYLPLVRSDSRIGYECTNHYFFLPQDIREKIVGCRAIIEELSDRRRGEGKR